MTPRFARAAVAALLLTLIAPMATAETITVTDIAGREVQVKVPVERVILGEGRQIYLVAALDTEDPFRRVVGWRDDLLQADPDTYGLYLEKYPQMADIPTFGGFKDGSFDIEQAIALRPDVMIMNLESKQATEDARYVEKLAAVGIPVVYVDFREHPFTNTEPSMRLIGRLFGKEQRAEAFIAFREREIARVTDVIAKANPQRPSVFIERAAGYSEDCCMSFGNDNFGRFVEMAGGQNIAKGIIPGTFGTLNPEQVIAANPEQVIITGSNWEAYVPGGKWVGVGPGADLEEAARKLRGLTERPAYTGVRAVETNKVHAIWHQFYNSPYQFVAIQRVAKWLHPDLFADLDPDATFRGLHERFLPVAYKPGYWVSLDDVD